MELKIYYVEASYPGEMVGLGNREYRIKGVVIAKDHQGVVDALAPIPCKGEPTLAQKIQEKGRANPGEQEGVVLFSASME